MLNTIVVIYRLQTACIITLVAHISGVTMMFPRNFSMIVIQSGGRLEGQRMRTKNKPSQKCVLTLN